MSFDRQRLALLRTLALLAVLGLLFAACGSDDPSLDAGGDTTTSDDAGGSDDTGSDDEGSDDDDDDVAANFEGTLVIGAIPDQDPEILTRNYGLLADYLADELGIDVEYRPVTEYDAAVTAFRVGDLDFVWFGGLTGVQARLQVEGAKALLQRDIDEKFTSVFIARVDSGIDPFDDVQGLEALADTTFTFGSESSTSGRLMPQSFLAEAGVKLDDFDGDVGFSGSHDKTIELVEDGAFEAGALNSQVWESRVEKGEVDTDEVQVIFETPEYYDYHWVSQPDLDDEFGEGFEAALVEALKNLDADDDNQAAILEFFSAESFIDTENANYDDIETVGREIGKIED